MKKPLLSALLLTALPCAAIGTQVSTASAATTSILCMKSGSTSKRVAKSRPTACNTLGPTSSFAGSVNLTGLKWSKWGSSVATATGTDKGFHEPAENVSVKVTVSGRKKNNCGGYSYTKVKVESDNGKREQSLPAKCSD
ncbi:MAG: hypothetical protein Q7T55_07915 [Solirubrobacteraceae bacterium]|nr:hypothetical protein [Solirubrobacteraceae bacterium]